MSRKIPYSDIQRVKYLMDLFNTLVSYEIIERPSPINTTTAMLNFVYEWSDKDTHVYEKEISKRVKESYNK